MKTKTLGQMVAVCAVGCAVSASAPVLASMTIEASALNSPQGSFETGKDPGDVMADRFWSMVNLNLAIKFSQTGGAEPDNVDVTIKDSAGKDVVDTKSDGGLLFTKLPEGNYSIEATWHGKTLKREVNLSSLGQSKVTLNWDTAPDPS